MNITKLFFALFVASISAVLSALMIRYPERIDVAAILLVPGAVIGIIMSGSVHNFSSWVVAGGNFAFYFGLVYLVWEIYKRCTRGTDNGKAD